MFVRKMITISCKVQLAVDDAGRMHTCMRPQCGRHMLRKVKKLGKKASLMQVWQSVGVVLRRELDVATAQLHRTQLGIPATQHLSMHI